MLPPHELKNKKFPLALRGYAQSEVNEHIDFIIEKYTELYKRNDELERELLQVNAKLEELESKEDAINRALVSAQKIQEKIITEAQAQAKTITDAAKKNTAIIIGEFSETVRKERATLHALIESVAGFKASVLEAYEKQISELDKIAPQNADPDWDRSDIEYVNNILQSIRQAAEDFEGSFDSEEGGNVSSEAGSFSGMSDEELEMTLSEQIRRKRPKPARTLHQKSFPDNKKEKNDINESSQKDSRNTQSSEQNDKEADDADTSTDEELKKLFSENI